MQDPLGYKGKRVVVAGAASGMGEATAAALLELEADVIALDIKKPALPVSTYIELDLRDRDSIDAGIAAIGGDIGATFVCAGLPGPPFTEEQVLFVNFFGARHFIESIADNMTEGAGIAWVSSNGGLGWEQNLDLLKPALAAEGFDGAKAWIADNAASVEGGMSYAISKQLVNAYVASKAGDFFAKGVRLNSTNPGPTATPMMPQFEENNGKELVQMALGPIHRYSTAEEQAWPLIYLNSPRSSYITGTTWCVDGGFLGALVMGQIDFSALTG